MRLQGRQVYLGTYPEPNVAARMYDYAARCLLSKSQMRLNFPCEPVCDSPHVTAKNAVAKAQAGVESPHSHTGNCLLNEGTLEKLNVQTCHRRWSG